MRPSKNQGSKDLQTQLAKQAAYWKQLKRHQKIIYKEGIFRDSYFFQGMLIAQYQGMIRGIGPNNNGLIILKNDNSLQIIPKIQRQNFWQSMTPIKKIPIDSMDAKYKCCMHQTKNKWATAFIENNLLSVTFNTYDKIIVSVHKAFECDDEAVHRINYDYTDKNDSLVVMTDAALYHVDKTKKKLLSIPDLAKEYIDAAWAKHRSMYRCFYESSYEFPHYFILRFEKKYVHPEPNEACSLFFKRFPERATCKLVFNNRVGFFQEPSFTDGFYTMSEQKKTPRRLLLLRSADEVIKNMINAIK